MRLAGEFQVELLEPRKFSCRQMIRCDCCRQERNVEEFEADGCGICIDCLECDDLLVDLEASANEPYPS